MRYMDGFVIPVPNGNKRAYIDMAVKAAPMFMEHGAIRVVETWGDDLPIGKVNDFRTAVIAEEGESVVFSWIEWPSKEVRDAGMAKVIADERMNSGEEIPFSGARMIYGGFATLVDTDEA
ncbi:MAG TPA: DUF1428 domain-containing protein [Sphingobium sp.]